MKKTSFIILICLSSIFAFSQKAKVTKASLLLKKGKIEKAKEIIDDASTDINADTWGKVWLVKGLIYKEIYRSRYRKIRDLDSLPLLVVHEAFVKGLQIEKSKNKGKNPTKTEKEILAELPYLSYYLQRVVGLQYYKRKQYERALEGFEKSLQVDSILKRLDYSDTLYYYTGLTAKNLSLYKKALTYFEAAAYLGYGDEDLYLHRADAYKAIGDTSKALKMTKIGLKRFPKKNQKFVEYAIETYIQQNDTTRALQFLANLSQKNKNNAEFAYGRGLVYGIQYHESAAKIFKLEEKVIDIRANLDKLVAEVNLTKNSQKKKTTRAIISSQRKVLETSNKKIKQMQKNVDFLFNETVKAYRLALKKNPEHYKANYNLGKLFYTKAKKILDAADYIPLKNKIKFQAEQERAKKVLVKAKPYFETIHKIVPDQLEIMQYLLLIYKKCGMPEKCELMQDDIWELQESINRKKTNY